MGPDVAVLNVIGVVGLAMVVVVPIVIVFTVGLVQGRRKHDDS